MMGKNLHTFRRLRQLARKVKFSIELEQLKEDRFGTKHKAAGSKSTLAS